MVSRVRDRVGNRGLILLFALLLSLPLAVGAWASAGRHGPTKGPATPTTKRTEGPNDDQGDAQSTGDTTARFHGDENESCDLPAGATALSGNWTHGDYVSAWARWAAQQKKQDLSTQSIGQSVRTAAQSDCGKPMASLRTESHGKSAEAKTHQAEHKP